MVAHSLFSFEKLSVKGGKLQRSTMTRGMDRVKASPEDMLGKLFGKGTLVLPRAKTGEVHWKGDGGQTRLLGRFETLGGVRVFVPTRATQRLRNRVLGQRMVAAVEGEFHSAGPYGTWLKPNATQHEGGGVTTFYKSMTRWPHGGSDASSVGIQDSAAYRTHDEDLYHALQPREGVSEGGLAVRYSQPSSREPGSRERVRVAFYPRGKSARRQSDFDKVVGLVMGFGESGGGVVVSRETVKPGQNPVRAMTRKQMHALRGYIEDQQNRWAQLGKLGSAKVGTETAIAEGLWQMGGRRYGDDAPSPKVKDKVPPNLMLSVLYGPGKLRVASDGAVAFHPLSGQLVTVGRMVNGAFQAAPEAISRRNELVGRAILGRVISHETARKGYGWDADHTFTRFPQTVIEKSQQTLSLPGKYSPIYVPMSQVVELRDASYHILDTVAREFPKAVEGVISSPERGKSISFSWRSREITVPADRYSGRGGVHMTVPAGHVVEHEMTLTNKPYDGQRIRYGYRIVPE